MLSASVSPTSHGVIKLERKMQPRVALYSSQDPAITGRVGNWPDLAEAHDMLHLMHGAHLRPYTLRKLILAHREGRDLDAELANLVGAGQGRRRAGTVLKAACYVPEADAA
jgi:hypothetical protein